MAKKAPKKTETKKKKAVHDDGEPAESDLAIDVVEPEDVDLDNIDLDEPVAEEKID